MMSLHDDALLQSGRPGPTPSGACESKLANAQSPWNSPSEGQSTFGSPRARLGVPIVWSHVCNRKCAGDGWSSRAADAILHGCIPVVLMDNVRVPFETIIDWSLFSIRIAEVSQALHSLSDPGMLGSQMFCDMTTLLCVGCCLSPKAPNATPWYGQFRMSRTGLHQQVQ